MFSFLSNITSVTPVIDANVKIDEKDVDEQQFYDAENETWSVKELLTPEEIKLHISTASAAVDEVLKISKDENWQVECSKDDDVVYSMYKNGSKIFKYEASFNATSKEVFDIVYYNTEKQPEWNSTVTDYQVLRTLDEDTDITWVIATEALGGVISSRDFVNLRQKRILEDGTYFNCGVSVAYSGKPDTPGMVRGINREGGYIIIPTSETTCKMLWILDTDLKGWIPRFVIDQATGTMMFQSGEAIRKRIEHVRSQGI
eukprot:Colp12_sorted_trinity150504_noHs@14244